MNNWRRYRSYHASAHTAFGAWTKLDQAYVDDLCVTSDVGTLSSALHYGFVAIIYPLDLDFDIFNLLCGIKGRCLQKFLFWQFVLLW